MLSFFCIATNFLHELFLSFIPQRQLLQNMDHEMKHGNDEKGCILVDWWEINFVTLQKTFSSNKLDITVVALKNGIYA